mmetsp:Transcript_45734/g.99646  ORF Transcript_45734/g.99646 Transcript_45734/m.99646 type:complete len:219 (-) Transcript_45734:1516-2172(-)
MAQGVSVLEQESAVLLEGVGISQEHRFGRNDLCVDDGEELDHRIARLFGQLTMENLPEFPQAPLTMLCNVRHLSIRCPLHAHAAQLLAQCQSLGFQLSGLLQEADQLFKASNCVDDLGEVARKLHTPKDVVPILLSSGGIGNAQHAHRLARLAHGGMNAALGQCQKGFADAKDQLRQVKGTQDVLRKNLSIQHQTEGLLCRGCGVIVVHQRGRHLDED